MHKHTLTISDKSGGLINLHLFNDPGMPVTAAVWIIDLNYIFLGADRWLEWNEIYGYPEKQKQFLQTVEKYDLHQLPPTLSTPATGKLKDRDIS